MQPAALDRSNTPDQLLLHQSSAGNSFMRRVCYDLHFNICQDDRNKIQNQGS